MRSNSLCSSFISIYFLQGLSVQYPISDMKHSYFFDFDPDIITLFSFLWNPVEQNYFSLFYFKYVCMMVPNQVSMRKNCCYHCDVPHPYSKGSP